MPVTVKTFASSGEAAAALSSDRGARYLGGGTLVMRALNEGDISISTVVRATDPALPPDRRSERARSRSAPASPSRAFWPSAISPFCTPPARSIGGPAVRNMGTVGGNLFAPSPYGDFTVALLALDATVSVQGGLGAREMPIEEFLQSPRPAERRPGAGRLVCSGPASADAFRYRKIARIKPKGGSVITLAAHLPASGGRIAARASPRLDGADADPRPRRRARAGGTLARRCHDRAAAAAAAEGVSPADNALASAWYRREIVGVHLRRLLSGQE